MSLALAGLRVIDMTHNQAGRLRTDAWISGR